MRLGRTKKGVDKMNRIAIKASVTLQVIDVEGIIQATKSTKEQMITMDVNKVFQSMIIDPKAIAQIEDESIIDEFREMLKDLRVSINDPVEWVRMEKEALNEMS